MVLDGNASLYTTGHDLSIEWVLPASLVVTNEDGSDMLRLAADGTVSGDLAERYPEAVPAFAELGDRIKSLMF